MSIVKSAGNVSGGLDKKVRAKMVSNVVIDVMIGLIPVLGDFADGFWQANTKNVLLLEAVLAQRALDLLEKAKLDSIEDGHAPVRTHAYANDHRTHDAHPFRQDAEFTSQAPARNHVYSDGAYDDGADSDLPPGYDERHAGVHQRLQAKESARKTQASQNGSGGGWLSRLQSRGQIQEARPAQPPRPSAPAQPPRPNQSRHRQVGSF